MTLAQLGRADLSPSFLSLVERDKSTISLRALSLVAHRLQLPMAYFIEEQDDPALHELTLDRAEAELLRGDPESCLRLLETLTAPEELEPRALRLRGRALMGTGQTRPALKALDTALALATERDDPALAAGIHYALAAALVTGRAYDDALVHVRTALTLVEQSSHDVILKARILMLLGDILSAQGDMDPGLASYEQAVDTADVMGDLDALGSLYTDLSVVAEAHRATANAQWYARMALATLTVRDDAIAAVRQIVTLADRYIQRGEPERALGYASKALARAQVLGSAELERRARLTLASIALDRQDLDTASAEATATLTLIDDGEEDAGTAWAVLSEVAVRKGEWERADALYRQALDAFKAAGSYRHYERTAVAFSRLLRDLRDTERALEYALLAAEARAIVSRS